MKTSLDAVAFMIEYLKPGDFESGTRAALLYLGIPTEMNGYRCLIRTIPMHHADTEASLTKELYPAVARQMDYRNWKRVEKQIRDAISAGWDSRNREVWEMYFPGGEKPSNGEFIATVVEILNLWVACKSHEYSH